MRITAACPTALISDSNQLAMVLAFGPADALTYRNPSWVDAEGNLYAAASFIVRPEWVTAAQGTLVRPAWDAEEPYTIDMDAAQRAQDSLVFATTPTLATPDTLTAIGGMEGREALAAMGLTQREDPEIL